MNAPPAKKVPELALHPLCKLIPPCTEGELKELKADIKANGLAVPIKLFEGKILDGRSRHQTCLELEKEFYPVEFKSEDFTHTTTDALAYVISMNVKRRHLKASQRAIIAARLVTTTLGGDRSVKLPTEITQEEVAKLSGVAVKMVTDAKKVLAYQADPELAKKVLNGEVAVAAAAKQVRDKEREANGKPPRGGGGKGGGSKGKAITYAQVIDAKTAVNAYGVLEEHLLDALQDLNKFSSFAHADEYAQGTIEKLQEKLNEMQPKEAA